MKLLKYIPILIILFQLSACQKDDDNTNKDDEDHAHETTGNLSFNVNPLWGSQKEEFSLNKDVIHGKTGDTLNFTMFRFYLTNIKLKKDDGTWWTEEESYRLIDLSDPTSTQGFFKDIPSGNYTDISFMIGVDSARNVSGAQSGALDPNEGMFWSWQTGYINVKAEGTSPNSKDGTFAFHLGGFMDDVNTVTTLNYTLTEPVTIGETSSKNIQFNINPGRFWHTAPGLSTSYKIHMPNATASQMATDFGTGVTVELID